ncbi:MAG: MCP four helix bundle domain-containing protein [Proteobacteria bacterium]|nr:MCP four helix bundle domain-containing protein [Pseudomonadota bacterium]
MVGLSLKNRIYLVNAILLGITIIGAVSMVWYTYKTEKIFKDILDKDLIVYQSAEALATSLINQKGFVSYYLLDKNPVWLDELHTYRGYFAQSLIKVKSLATDTVEIQTIAQIEERYADYLQLKDKVINFYKSREYDQGSVLHTEARKYFPGILELCEALKTFHKDKIASAIQASQKESNRLRYMALMAIIIVIVLSLLINYIFARHILAPIRKIAAQADKMGGPGLSSNELINLEHSVHGLIEDAEHTQQVLKKSQEVLLQSEKMALLGKLAAGTAHSIRNPLTSVKMRLFSLSKTCQFTNDHQEDFNVISGEIKQINKIVENFLEFSRPPKLQTIKMSPSTVVDSALYLLEQRLKSYQVTTRLIRKASLSETLIDPEQLKEVLVNIIINACESIQKDGLIIITEEENFIKPLNRVAVIRIMDNGPGISREIQSQIFNPFFTTKEEGTGLGLSIAFNIINEHGGWLDVNSSESEGTSFIITLPIKDA